MYLQADAKQNAQVLKLQVIVLNCLMALELANPLATEPLALRCDQKW